MQTMTPLLVNVAPSLFKIDPPSWGELGVYFVGLLSLLGVIYTATATRKTGREANAVNQLPLLWDRIDKLEKREKSKDDRMDELEESQQATDRRLTETLEILSVAIEFIERLYMWGRQGGGEPEPTVPDKLRDWVGHIIHRDEP